MYTIAVISKWDETFFEDFLQFRNTIHRSIPTSFQESLSDYVQYFGPQSIFSEYNWIAIMIKDGQNVCAKCILTWKKNTKVGHLGFIDFLDDEVAAQSMQEEVERIAKESFLTQIKTPVDINFFIKYRIRCEGGSAPYYGEPIYPSYYHKVFEKLNYKIIGSWDTYQLTKFSNILSFSKERKNQKKKKQESHHHVRVRSIRLDQWDEELKIVHELFLRSYKNMPEFEPISLEQFKIVYDNFKYLINPHLAHIIESDGRPVGFSICYVDPLKILKAVDGKKLGPIGKAILLMKLKLNRSNLLMVYVGKISGPNGEEIKGIQYKTSKLLWKWVLVMKKSLVCYQAEDSPSRRTWRKHQLKSYAKYVLYGKDLN